MKKWNDKEYGAVKWVLQYISEASVEEKHRKCLRELREIPLTKEIRLTNGQMESLIAAICYFEELYTRMSKGYPKGNRTVRDILMRTEYLRSAREKIKGEN